MAWINDAFDFILTAFILWLLFWVILRWIFKNLKRLELKDDVHEDNSKKR